MDRSKYLFNYVFVMRFAVHLLMGFQCKDEYLLSPNLTVGENNFILAKNESYIDIKANQILHLKCEGIEPITWILPEYHPHFDQLPDFIRINTTFFENKYESQLTIEDIITDDVGYYSCHYNKSLRKDVDTIRNKFNSIYIFITDTEKLFMKTILVVPAVNNSGVNIPCRPSSSFTQMTLWEVDRYNSSALRELSISPENGVTFDPMLGFKLKSLKAEKLQCVARLKDTVSMLNISIHYSDGIEYEPEIDEGNTTFIFVGDSFTLNCKIKMIESSQLNLKWTTSEVCTQDWEQRLEIGNFVITPIGNKKIMSSNISVVNAQLSDSGTYRCIAYDWADSQKEVTKFIQIYDSPQLNLYTDYESQSLTCNQKFIFNVTIRAVPNEEIALNLIWMKDMVQILEDNDRIIISRNKSEFTELRIDNPDVDDSGVYSLHANLLDNLYANVSLNLTVRGCRSRFILKKTGQRYAGQESSHYDKDQIVLIVVFSVFGGVLLIMAVFLGRKIKEERKQKRELEFLSYNLFENGQMDLINPDMPLDEQIDLLPYDNKWEFARENLKLGPILGQGAFGRVVRAEAYCIEDSRDCTSITQTTTVAVKMLKEKADMSQRRALLAELKILIHVGKHMNIVNLLGAVTKDLIRGELMVIVEYCLYGNIRSFLLAHRRTFVNQLNKDNDEIDPTITIFEEKDHKYANDSFMNENLEHRYQNLALIKETPVIRGRSVTSSDLVSYVFQCAKGMEYLSSKKLIHRDLAARNVLLADDDVIKICDFGLARDCYNYDNYIKKGDGPLPIKWMAIESMRDKVYTSKSDVWSFGIFMWEIFTLGANPYPGFELDEEFYRKLLDGYRMERPELSPINIYSIMKECWKHEPSDRPDFTLISSQLQNMMEVNAMKRYNNQLEQYQNKTDRNSCIEYMRMDSESDRIVNYVDMTANDDDSVDVVVGNNPKPNYDDVKNVRSIFMNTPVPNQPMEVVPMIQL